MAEEIKQEEKKCCCSEGKNMPATIFKVLLGLALLGLGVWAIMIWSTSLTIIIKGCAGPLLILAAIVILAIARE